MNKCNVHNMRMKCRKLPPYNSVLQDMLRSAEKLYQDFQSELTQTREVCNERSLMLLMQLLNRGDAVL